MKNYSDLDSILIETQKQGLYPIDMDTPDNDIKAIKYLEGKGLIFEKQNSVYALKKKDIKLLRPEVIKNGKGKEKLKD